MNLESCFSEETFLLGLGRLNREEEYEAEFPQFLQEGRISILNQRFCANSPYTKMASWFCSGHTPTTSGTCLGENS